MYDCELTLPCSCSCAAIAYKFVDLRNSEEKDATLNYEEFTSLDQTLTEGGTLPTMALAEDDKETSSEKKNMKRPLEDPVCLAGS